MTSGASVWRLDFDPRHDWRCFFLRRQNTLPVRVRVKTPGLARTLTRGGLHRIDSVSCGIKPSGCGLPAFSHRFVTAGATPAAP